MSRYVLLKKKKNIYKYTIHTTATYYHRKRAVGIAVKESFFFILLHFIIYQGKNLIKNIKEKLFHIYITWKLCCLFYVDVCMLHVVGGGWIFFSILIYLVMVGSCTIHVRTHRNTQFMWVTYQCWQRNNFRNVFCVRVFMYRRKKNAVWNFGTEKNHWTKNIACGHTRGVPYYS